ncbi:MAG: spore cortex biosynthesis protein YabQ [Clostridia bacterium]|nr:spore cortex biosynthesis protein YabQ [Clostridia bacterium]
MYLKTIGEQTVIFLYSCGFGFILGIIFDLFELAGEFLPRKKAIIFAKDIIYMVLCAFLSFLFSLAADNGSFRFYIYAAFPAGWFIYYFSVGSFTRRVRQTFSTFIRGRFLKFVRKTKEKNAKKFKKSKISSDLLLQDKDLMLYNKKDNS